MEVTEYLSSTLRETLFYCTQGGCSPENCLCSSVMFLSLPFPVSDICFPVLPRLQTLLSAPLESGADVLWQLLSKNRPLPSTALSDPLPPHNRATFKSSLAPRLALYWTSLVFAFFGFYPYRCLAPIAQDAFCFSSLTELLGAEKNRLHSPPNHPSVALPSPLHSLSQGP